MATATGDSTGGGNVDVSVTQAAGSGGALFGASGAGGNGAASNSTNAVSGSTSGMLRLFQNANGGGGGLAFGANSGHGGNAFSSLTSNNPGSGPLEGRVGTVGGPGGGTSGSGTPGNGGDATGFIELTNNNTALAIAGANAGPGGSNFGAGTFGTAGVGTATAHATTTGGFRVQAQTNANGRTTTGTSLADTSSAGAISAMSLRSHAQGFPSASTNAVGTIGGSQFLSTGSYNSTLLSSALPQASDVTNALGFNPNVTAAYNSPDGFKTPIALVAMGLNSFGNAPAVATTLSVSADYALDVSMLTHGNLKIGLLDPFSSGPGFTSLHFSIEREGMIVEDQMIASAAAANTYFNDHVLSLGALTSGVTGMLDLTFLLEMNTLDDGTRFGTTFLIADVGLVGGLPGDYNNNGKVDAADYTVWRNNLGSAVTLPNDTTPGSVTSVDYDVWKTNFGMMAGSGSSTDTNPSTLADGAVPEPACLLLLIAAAFSLVPGRRYVAILRR